MEWICQAAPREYRFPCFRLFLPGCLLVAVASRRASSSLACAKIDRPDNTSPGEGSKNEFDDREKETTVTRSRVEATGPTTRRMNRATTIGTIERTIGRSKGGCVRRKWRRAVPISREPWWTQRERDSGQKGGNRGPNFIRCFRIAAQILGHEICFGLGKLAEQRETPSYLTYLDEQPLSSLAACCRFALHRIKSVSGGPCWQIYATLLLPGSERKVIARNGGTESTVTRPGLDSLNFGKLNRSNYTAIVFGRRVTGQSTQFCH